MDSIPKSCPYTERVYVRFVNKTGRITDVFWVDYDGSPVKYSTLPPDGYIDMDTFAHHPWIFKDHITRDRLAVNNELCYVPLTFKELFEKEFSKEPENMLPHRIIVMITLPVYSLKERSLQVVRDTCINLSESAAVLKHLEKHLPKSVMDDLIIKIFMKDGVYLE